MTVCVPAYQSEDLVSETLASVAGQTHERIRVLVSVDASSDRTAEACRAYERDRRFRVFVQPLRLGWVANINFLLERVRSDFFLILPHDDLIAEDYVEALRAAALGVPQAIVAYADAQDFGESSQVRSIPGLDGPLNERVRTLLVDRWTGGPWRGLTRASVLRAGVRMVDNSFEGFGADALWALTLLCRGPFERVPRGLYRKRVEPGGRSLVQTWQQRSLEERFARWAEHSGACLRAIGEADASDEVKLRLVVVQVARALETGPGASRRTRPDDQQRREELVMLAVLAARSLGIGELSSQALLALRNERPLWKAISALREQ